MRKAYCRILQGGLALLLLGVGAACSDLAIDPVSETTTMTLRLEVPELPPASISGTGVSLDLTVGGPNNNTISVDSVQFVARDVEMKRSSGEDCQDTDQITQEEPTGEQCEEFFVGPAVVNLPIDQLEGPITDPQRVQTSTYDRFEFNLDVARLLDPGDRDVVGQHGYIENASVRMVGEYNGEPFEFLQDIDREIELPLSPVLEMGNNEQADVTLVTQVLGWFQRDDRTLIDPRTVSQTDGDACQNCEPDLSIVRNNIIESFSVTTSKSQ